MLGKLIGGFVVLLVGVGVWYGITPTITSTLNVSNVSGANETILGLVPLFFALAMAMAAISIIFSAFGRSGLAGSDEDEDEDVHYDFKERIIKASREEESITEELLRKKKTPLPKIELTEEDIIRSEFD